MRYIIKSGSYYAQLFLEQTTDPKKRRVKRISWRGVVPSHPAVYKFDDREVAENVAGQLRGIDAPVEVEEFDN